MVRGRKPKQRPHKPAELGPRVFKRGRWFAADLRPWQAGRPTLRNPKHPAWPKRGEQTDDPEIALRWVWAYVDEIRSERRRRILGIPKERGLGKAIQEYLEHRRNTREFATWSADRTAVGHLLDALGPKASLASIGGERLQGIFDSLTAQGYRASTLQTYRKTLQTFFLWAGFPFPDVELPNPGKVDVRTLEPDECDRIRAAASKVDRLQTGHFPSARLAIEVGLSMGLRQGEVFALRWNAIDSEEQSVRVQWQLPKDGTVPKPLKGKLSRTAGILQEWWPLHRQGSGFVVGRNEKPVGSRTQRNLITRVLDTAGLNDVGVGWHLLRHTYARYFIERGGRFSELQKSLGHASASTTERIYGHFHEDVAWKLARERIYRT